MECVEDQGNPKTGHRFLLRYTERFVAIRGRIGWLACKSG